MDHQEAQAIWAECIVEELTRCGVRHFVIAPGSRSTPLTAAIARTHQPIERTLCHDERAAGFLALGSARSTGTPAAVVCTSGTAVANLAPATIEADQDRVPMLLLTADRPPELRDTRANQTINQPGIFGTAVRWAVDLPAPDPAIDPAYLLTTIDQAVFRSRYPDPGPVHLNCMLREPLAPPQTRSSCPAGLESWSACGAPWTTYHLPQSLPCAPDPGPMRAALEGTEELLVLLGRSPRRLSPTERQALEDFCTNGPCPVWADINAGVAPPGAVQHFDLLLRAPGVRERLRKVGLLHLGGPMLSKQLLDFLQHEHSGPYIQVDTHAWRQDPAHRVTHRFIGEPVALLQAAADRAWPGPRSMALQAELRGLADRVKGQLHACLKNNLSEPALARALTEVIPHGHVLFSGNSMPIRDLDHFAAARPDMPPVLANRGASGIDGNLATALGIALGGGVSTTALLGDLALLHDIGSLATCAAQQRTLEQRGLSFVLVVVNNHGGGIFSFLPIAGQADLLTPYFDTPHTHEFRHAAPLFGLHCSTPSTLEQFRADYLAACRIPGAHIIEVQTDRAENLRIHQDIYAAVETVLST